MCAEISSIMVILPNDMLHSVTGYPCNASCVPLYCVSVKKRRNALGKLLSLSHSYIASYSRLFPSFL